MSISTKIARHLRSNAIAYVALFVALSGTAIALPGKNKVKSDDIARGAVKGKALRDGVVSTPKVRDGAINSAKLANGSVINAKLGDGVITSGKLADDSVVRAKIAAGEVNGGKLANGSVNSAKVNDGSLLAQDFAPGQLSDGFVLSGSDAGPYEVPPMARSGELLVIITFRALCEEGAAPCTAQANLNGMEIPGASFAMGVGTEQITLVGVAPTIGAGPNEIGFTQSGNPIVGEVRIAGVLLQ